MHRLQYVPRPRTMKRCRSALHAESRPWARNGGAAGIRYAFPSSIRSKEVLVVGAGPAGLEAALALGQRGYEVTPCREDAFGGRPSVERVGIAGSRQLDTGARLSGAHDFRNAECGGISTAALGRHDIIDLAPITLFWPPEAAWRRDLSAWCRKMPQNFPQRLRRMTFSGVPVGRPGGYFDDDNYFMGGALAEKLRQAAMRLRW